jgi:hypothetical protein
VDELKTVTYREPHRNEVRITGTLHDVQNRGRALGVAVRAIDAEGRERYYGAVTENSGIGKSFAEMKPGDMVTLSGAISEVRRQRLSEGGSREAASWVDSRNVTIEIANIVEHEPVAQPAPLPTDPPAQGREPTLTDRLAGLFRRAR